MIPYGFFNPETGITAEGRDVWNEVMPEQRAYISSINTIMTYNDIDYVFNIGDLVIFIKGLNTLATIICSTNPMVGNLSAQLKTTQELLTQATKELEFAKQTLEILTAK